MKHLDYTLIGGMPLELDDLEWEQQGIHGAFKGIVDAFHRNAITDNEEPYVLSGVKLSPGTDPGEWTITPGYIVFSGVIYYYPGAVDQSLPGGPEAWGLTPATDLDPSGSEVFEDLVTRNAYVRDAVTIASETPLPPLGFWRFHWGQRLEDRIRQMVALELPGEWNVVGGVGQPTFQNGFNHGSGDDRIQFRREPGNIVRLRGELRGELSTGAVAFTLPVGFRPVGSVPIAVTLPRSSESTLEHRVIRIYPNGDVAVQFLTSVGVGDRFRLDGVPAYYAGV